MEILERNAPCWCGSGKKYKKCHEAFDEKLKMYENKGVLIPSHEIIKTPSQIEKIRESAKINIAVLDYVAEHIQAGITTQEIDDWVYKITTEAGGIPAPLDYEGYPKSVCTSINDQVCHGIPSEDVTLKEGDIVNVDVSTILDGYFSDSSRMFCIGQVSPEAARLVRVTRECMEAGIAMVRPWTFLGDMGAAVHEHAQKNGYSVVRDIGGHGVGLAFEDLINGRIDGVVCDDPVATQFALLNKDYAKKIKIGFIIPAEEVEEYGFAVNKGDKELVDLLNKGIRAVKAKGIDAQLKAKWFKSAQD